MKLIDKRNGYEVYDMGNGYTVAKEICSWISKGYRFQFYSDFNSYLPDIYDHSDSECADTGFFFEVQTTSYGSLPLEEIEKLIKGYQTALDTIRSIKEAFETQNNIPFYFTFGSWEKYPYQDTYLVVYATDLNDAIKKYRERHPDIHENTVNCAAWYRQEQWEGSECQKAWKDREPAEIIR